MEGWTTGALAFMHGISRCQLLWIARSHRTGRCPHGVSDYARSPPDDLASPARPPRQARASRGHGTAHTGALAANASTRPVQRGQSRQLSSRGPQAIERPSLGQRGPASPSPIAYASPRRHGSRPATDQRHTYLSFCDCGASLLEGFWGLGRS